MFESALIDKLKSDAALAALVTTFSGNPAIFSEYAPETAVTPFIVCRITPSSEYSAIHSFSVMVDYFDYNKSRKNSRDAAERIEYVLDHAILQHERYIDIRLMYLAGSPVESGDARDIHYNVQFSARGTRKKWIVENH
jgi:hypothetical protein